jgi:hypothetical protein
MTRRNDLDQQLNAFLRNGPTELPDPSFDAVRDRTESTRQRVVLGPWRVPDMNKFLAVGLAAAAVVVIAVIALNLLPGSPAPGGQPPESVAPSQAPSEPAPSAWVGLPEGPFVVTGTDDPVQVTIDIASPGWSGMSEFDAVTKDDDGLDPPESVGAALLAWAWPAGTVFNVYQDPCLWRTTTPSTAATTPDQIAAALAAQAQSDATAPVDVTVGGYAGKATTLTVPMSYYLDENATREEEFADCDESLYGFYAAEVETEPSRNAQGPGQIDELWILDVDGAIVILDATYSPATPADLVEEMRAMAESATFEAR